MPNRSKVVDRDAGYRALIDMVTTISRDKPGVAIGVVGARARMPHQGGGGTVVDIAAKHEFGAGRTPQRSVIGATIDAKAEAYRAFVKRQFKATALYHARTRQKWSAERSVALKRLGLLVSGDMKDRILSGIAPPLTPYTLKRKGPGKTTPLVDSGHLARSYSFEVRAKR